MAFKLDFDKLRDPAYQEQRRKEREEESARLEAHERKLRGWLNVALDRYDQVDEREREFIRSCRTRIYRYQPLSETQEKWLEDIAQRPAERVRRPQQFTGLGRFAAPTESGDPPEASPESRRDELVAREAVAAQPRPVDAPASTEQRRSFASLGRFAVTPMTSRGSPARADRRDAAPNVSAPANPQDAIAARYREEQLLENFGSRAEFLEMEEARDETPEVESFRRLDGLVKEGVLDRLPGCLLTFLDEGRVLLAGAGSDYLPANLRAEFARKRGSGLAVCALREDGQIVVALDDDAHDSVSLQHELIHAAQVTASEYAMEAAFRAAAQGGSEVVQQIALQSGCISDVNGDYRDVDWTASACRVATLTNEERRIKDPDEQRDALMGALELALAVHPTGATLEIGKQLGIENPRALVAALHAHFMLESGFSSWRSDVAREIVAYRFEANWHPAMEALATDALHRNLEIEDETAEDQNRPRG
jgi:hypothetical protein